MHGKCIIKITMITKNIFVRKLSIYISTPARRPYTILAIRDQGSTSTISLYDVMFGEWGSVKVIATWSLHYPR